MNGDYGQGPIGDRKDWEGGLCSLRERDIYHFYRTLVRVITRVDNAVYTEVFRTR